MRRLVLVTILAVSPCAAHAADRAFVGVLAMAVEDRVAQQLGLGDDTKRQLHDLIRRREDAAAELVFEIKDLPQAEQTARLRPFVLESERLGLGILTEPQRTLLQRLRIARAGMTSLGEAEVAKSLGLNDQQQAEVKRLLEEREGRLRTGEEQDRETAQGEYERRLAAMLTPAQRASWEGLAGLGAAQPAKNGTDQASSKDRQTPPPAATEKDKPESPPGPTIAPSDTAPLPPDGKLRFQFRFAPWKEVLDWFARNAGLSLVMDSPPQGTFNYTDPREYTAAEAIDLLNSILLTKGFTLVRRERMLLLVNLEDGVPPNLVTRVTVEELDKRGEYELVSCLFPLTRATTEEIEPEIAKLIGPQGSIVVLPKARQVLVTETAGKLRTIRSVIQAVDNPGPSKQQAVRMLELKSLTAEAFMAIARPLLGMIGEQNELADGALRIAVDPQQPKLFASGKLEQLERLEEIQKLVDVPGAVVHGAGVAASPQLETYAVDAADPATALQVLQTMLAGLPDVRLATDPITGNLIALARPAEHATIKATLAQLQRDAKRIEVVTLRRLDPQLAAVAINKLFGGEGDKPARNAPFVEPDPVSGQLVIRGTESQIAQIRALLEKMGETSIASEGVAAAGSGNVRVLPFAGRPAREALEQVQLLWPTMRKNAVRVVTPSATTPASPPGLPAANDRLPQSPAPAAKAASDAASTTKPPPAPSDNKSAARRPAARGPWRFASALFAEAAAEDKPAADEPTADKPAEIIVAPGPGGIVIASEDRDALDAFEQLLRTVFDQRRLGPQAPTVFYLRYARAETAAELLQQVLSGEVADSSGGGGGSLLGDLASSALGEVGGGLVSGLLGLGGGATRSTATSSVSITPDTRLNALIVHASPNDLELIEQLLKVLDQEASPEKVQTLGKPRLIPLVNTRAEEVANVVRQVYASRVISGPNAQQPPSPEELLRALRGGKSNSGSKSKSAEDQQKMSIGVDPRSNSLVVSAPEPLFQEVKALVEEIDKAGLDVDTATEVISIRGTNPLAVQQALSSMMGDSLRMNKPLTQTGTTPTSPGSSQSLRDQVQRRLQSMYQNPNAAMPGAIPLPGRSPSGMPGLPRSSGSSPRRPGR